MKINEEAQKKVIRSAKKQNCFKLILDNQLVVYANQPIVFIISL